MTVARHYSAPRELGSAEGAAGLSAHVVTLSVVQTTCEVEWRDVSGYATGYLEGRRRTLLVLVVVDGLARDDERVRVGV